MFADNDTTKTFSMWSDHLLKANISIATSGDNTIISAPGAGKRICIDHLNLKLAATAQTLQLKDGSTAYGGAYPLAASEGLVVENGIKNKNGIITLSANSAFVINLSASAQVSGFVRYRIEEAS